MIVADTNYTKSLLKIEQIKTLISDFEQDISNQIPQEITNHFDKTKSLFLNSIEEIEITLTEFNSNQNE